MHIANRGALHLHLLQHNEKSSVPLKEVCTRSSIGALFTGNLEVKTCVKMRSAEFRTQKTTESRRIAKSSGRISIFLQTQAMVLLSIVIVWKAFAVNRNGCRRSPRSELCTGAEFFAQEASKRTTSDLNRAKNERITRIDSFSRRADECH